MVKYIIALLWFYWDLFTNLRNLTSKLFSLEQRLCLCWHSLNSLYIFKCQSNFFHFFPHQLDCPQFNLLNGCYYSKVEFHTFLNGGKEHNFIQCLLYIVVLVRVITLRI